MSTSSPLSTTISSRRQTGLEGSSNHETEANSSSYTSDGVARRSPPPSNHAGLPGMRRTRQKDDERSGRFETLKSRLTRKRASGGFLLSKGSIADRSPSTRKRESQDGKGKQRARSRPSAAYEDIPSSRPSTRFEQVATPSSSHRRSESVRDLQDGSLPTMTPPRSQGSSKVTPSTTSASSKTTGEQRALFQHDLSANHTDVRAPSIDASQLVRLALNLNESRRMQLSPGQLASIGSTNDRRIDSGDHTISVDDTAFVSDQTAPMQVAGRGSRVQHKAHGPLDGAASNHDTHHVPIMFRAGDDYHFSPTTLIRAEKAKTHLELRYEYRRLLGFLPDLKAPSAYGAPDSIRLGRKYNPLQYIRNRKVRARRRDPVDGVADGWNNPVAVKQWVDEVEHESRDVHFCTDGIASLPDWTLYKTLNYDCSDITNLQDGSGSAASQPPTKRLRVDWTLNPPDLFADAYWLESRDHKASIEGHDGNLLLDQMNTPERVVTTTSARRQTSVSSLASRSDNGVAMYSPETNTSSMGSPRPKTRRTDSSSHQHHQHSESRASRVKRHIFGRSRALSSESTDLSTSDLDEPRGVVFRSRSHNPDINVGPLERHINKMIESESRNQSLQDVTSPLSSPNDSNFRRHGVSEESHGPSDSQRLDLARERSRRSTSLTDSPSTTPRISVDDFDARPHTATNGNPIKPESRPSTATQDFPHPRKRRPFDLRQWQKPKHSSKTDTTDFALQPAISSMDQDLSKSGNVSTRSSSEQPDSSRLECEASRSLATENSSPRRSLEQADRERKSPERVRRRLFKNGRVGEIVRDEIPASHLAAEPKVSARASFSSITSKNKDDPVKAESKKASQKNGRLSVSEVDRSRGGSHERRRSSQDMKDPVYHVKNLPSFVPSNQRSRSGSREDDHISRQQRWRRHQRERSRIRGLAPISVDTSDVSPTNSSPDLTRYNTAEQGDGFHRTDHRKDRSESRSSAEVRAADKRLNTILSTPGGVGQGGLPTTGLSHVRARRNDRTTADPRSFASQHKKTGRVSGEDVFYVRSLLLATGFRARNFANRPDRIQDPPSKFLIDAALAAGKSPSSLPPRLLREEHVLAAQLLSSHLSSTMSAFDRSTSSFKNTTCSALTTQIDDLRDRVNTQLTPRVQTTVDEADAIVARLTTQHTLDVKRVNDAVDLMIRMRRRRLRWMRGVGFTLLEWMLVGLMWLIWLFVILLRAIRTMARQSIRLTKWLFWL